MKCQHPNNLVHELPVCHISVQFHRQDNVFIDIQNGDKVIVLEYKADVAAAEDGQLLIALLRQLIPTDNDAAGGRRIQSSHHVKQGGFTAAGRSDYRQKLPLFHGKADAVQGPSDVRFTAIILFQVDCL